MEKAQVFLDEYGIESEMVVALQIIGLKDLKARDSFLAFRASFN